MKIRSEWSGFVSTILLTVPDRERKTVEENDGKLLRVLVPSVGLSEWQASFAQRSAVSESCHTFWSNEMTRHCSMYIWTRTKYSDCCFKGLCISRRDEP